MLVEGKNGIKACIVADSISESGKRITTFELEFPRFILPEFNTHRQFSRNSASSRAIPVKKMIEIVNNNPATPVHWGKNQPGMQADEECSNLIEYTEHPFNNKEITREQAWGNAKNAAVFWAQKFDEAGYHKQIVNRLLEPFQMMKTVVTATEFDNFFWLRRHEDAQPEIKELANCMYEALWVSQPEKLKYGEWHTPYVEHKRNEDGSLSYVTIDGEQCDAETALKVSASCCAQVSYRVLDGSVEKAISIYKRLVESKPVHASPFEHQATPMGCFGNFSDHPAITHIDRSGNFWSGNLRGWIQHRQMIPDNVKKGY